jgi:hypothetical protein
MNVEIELRVPTFVMKDEFDAEKRVDNSHIRFRSVIEVPAFPKPASKIALNIGTRLGVPCLIERADWNEAKQMFVLTCQYPTRRISPAEYEALLNDPQWKKTELPA